MSMRTYQENVIRATVTFTALDCPACGAVFATTDEMIERRRQDHQLFYCPNGHSMSYGETTVERQLEQARTDLAKSRAAIAEERAYASRLYDDLAVAKKEAKRLARRAAAGVCPCCHRTIQQMARHMQSKHPEVHND